MFHLTFSYKSKCFSSSLLHLLDITQQQYKNSNKSNKTPIKNTNIIFIPFIKNKEKRDIYSYPSITFIFFFLIFLLQIEELLIVLLKRFHLMQYIKTYCHHIQFELLVKVYLDNRNYKLNLH